MKSHASRRAFLVEAAAVSAVAPSLARVMGANDRIHMGLVGAGKRGFSLMNRIRTQTKYPVLFTAVSDILPEHLSRASAATGESAEKYADYRALLNQKDLGAVLIATPEHWHRDQLIDALSAGKDVYIETPFSHTVDEANEMVAAASGSKQVVQVGAQERSAPHFLSAKAEIVDPGRLGTIAQVSSWWRFRPAQPEPNDTEPAGLDWARFFGRAERTTPSARRFWEWEYFWDYSGGLVTAKGHHVCDWVHWFAGAERPIDAVMVGGTHAMKWWEVPDTFTAAWRYPGDMVSEFSASGASTFADWHDHGACFRGTGGTLQISRRGWRYYDESEKRIVKESGGSDMDGAHVENFLECVTNRSRKPNAAVESGRAAACAAHLANIAFREKRKASLDDGWKVALAYGR